MRRRGEVVHVRVEHGVIIIIVVIVVTEPRRAKEFQRANGIATAGQSALTMFYCYVTDRIDVHVADGRTAVH